MKAIFITVLLLTPMVAPSLARCHAWYLVLRRGRQRRICAALGCALRADLAEGDAAAHDLGYWPEPATR